MSAPGPGPTSVPAAVAGVAASFGAGAFFGLSGSGNFHLTHELRDAGLEYYAATHEAGCVAMADGYARTAGLTGIATVHQGPGLTNAATALREAVRSHTPLVLFAADVPAGAVDHNQHLDQAAFAASLGAAVETLDRPEAVAADTARCFRRAAIERRPVVVLLPIDVQEAWLPAAASQFDPGLTLLPEPPPPAEEAVAEAVELLRLAHRPAILAGRGAIRPAAASAIAALADALAAPLLTSAAANWLFRGHPRNLGLAGGFGTPAARAALGEADLVLVFGCSLNPWTMVENEDLAEHAAIVQVDSRPPASLGRMSIRLPIVADCAATARALTARLGRNGGGEGGTEAPAAAEAPRPTAASAEAKPGVIDPRLLTGLLDEMLPFERTVSIDSGHFMVFPGSALCAPDPAGFLFAQGFMSMGLALAEGIGAAVARPERLCLVTVGDGGAKMSLAELDTAVRHRLPLLVVVYNDAAFGAEVHDFAGAGRALDTVRFADVDFATIARGLGAEGLTVRAADDLEPLREWLDSPTLPLVVDAKVDPDVEGPWLD